MDVNAVEAAQNTQSELDKYLQKKNLFVRLFYRTNRQRLTYFLIVFSVIILTILYLVLKGLEEAFGFGDLYLGLLTAFVFFGYAVFSTFMCSAFKRKEEKIKKLGISGNQQPRTDDVMEQLIQRLEEEQKKLLEAKFRVDEENKTLRRLLWHRDEEIKLLRERLEEQKKPPAGKAEISPADRKVKLVSPIVMEGSGSKVAGQLTSVQIHDQPVGTTESHDSSENSGRGHNTMAISEKHESSVTGEVTDLAVCSDDLDYILAVQMEEENLEESTTKLDTPEQFEMKEFGGASSLEKAKYTKKSDLLPAGGEDCESLSEKSDAVTDTLPKDEDKDDEPASSYAPPGEQKRSSA